MEDHQKMDDYWQNRPDSFDSFYKEDKRHSPKTFVSRFLDARTERLLDMAKIDLTSTLLDLGCGSGIHMSLFCSQCKQITGIDYSEKMVETARKLMEGTRAENWELHVADAQALPLDDRKFDWIISMGLLDYVESPQRVLRECHRVLKDNGAIVFTIPKTPSLFSFLRSPIGNMIKRTVFSLPPVDNVTSRKGLEALLGASGFQLCEVSSVWTAMWIVKATKADHTEPEAS